MIYRVTKNNKGLSRIILSLLVPAGIYSIGFFIYKNIWSDIKLFELLYDLSISAFGALISVWIAEKIFMRREKNTKSEKRKRWLQGVRTYINVFASTLIDVNVLLLEEVKKDYNKDFEEEILNGNTIENTMEILVYIHNKKGDLEKYLELVAHRGLVDLNVIIPRLNEEAERFVETHLDNHLFTPREIGIFRHIASFNPFILEEGTDLRFQEEDTMNQIHVYLNAIRIAIKRIPELW